VAVMNEASRCVFTCACVQMTSGPDRAQNIRLASEFVRAAADQGAAMAALPEAVDLLDGDNERMRQLAVPMGRHPALEAFRELAQACSVWLLVGSVTTCDEGGDPVNRSVLFDSSGRCVAHYDKIHLFDADVPDSTASVESNLYRRGTTARVAGTPWGPLGMTICYDLRFPHLYRSLAHAGATLLSSPSAFMQSTGVKHWHTLVRARAIENGCFVIAPAQCGLHPPTRRSFGHSLIVDPWGAVLADGGTDPCLVVAEIDMAEVQSARSSIRSLSHDRSFDVQSDVGGGA